MTTNFSGTLEFNSGCYCAGTGCGGHLTLTITAAADQLVAQHTWTPACDGLHVPGPCTSFEATL